MKIAILLAGQFRGDASMIELHKEKIGNYGKYAALTALGTYMILNPQKAQAQSPAAPGGGF